MLVLHAISLPLYVHMLTLEWGHFTHLSIMPFSPQQLYLAEELVWKAAGLFRTQFTSELMPLKALWHTWSLDKNQQYENAPSISQTIASLAVGCTRVHKFCLLMQSRKSSAKSVQIVGKCWSWGSLESTNIATKEIQFKRTQQIWRAGGSVNFPLTI